MSSVYRAIDTRFNLAYAIKEMLDEFQSDAERQQAVEWFSREATLMLELSHPGIPHSHDFFTENDRHYLIMDFVEGRTLSDVLEEEGNIVGVNGARGVSETHARNWGEQLCAVLSYLHSQSPPIIFRVLHPANVMVTDRDEIKLVGFDIARIFQPQQADTIVISVGYVPPEQPYGMPEPRSDLYALGATLHRVLTHHDPANNKPSIFSFPSIRTLRPDISPEFEQVVIKALEPEVEKRWASAAEMERAILNLPQLVPTRSQAIPLGVVPTGWKDDGTTLVAPTGKQAIPFGNARILIEIDGKIVGEYPLNKPVVTVGRISKNDVQVPNQRVSRLHARIRWENSVWLIEDAESFNGLIYQGRRVERLVLKDGDRVHLAPTVVLEYRETST